MAPITRAVQPHALRSKVLQHVDGAHGRGLRFWVKRDTGPEALIENFADGVFLDVVDDDALGLHFAGGLNNVHDEARALALVFEVRGVDED